MGSLTSTNKCWQMAHPLNVCLRNNTHIDEALCLWNTRITVYCWVRILTQARQLRGECAFHSAILSVPQLLKELYWNFVDTWCFFPLPGLSGLYVLHILSPLVLAHVLFFFFLPSYCYLVCIGFRYRPSIVTSTTEGGRRLCFHPFLSVCVSVCAGYLKKVVDRLGV